MSTSTALVTLDNMPAADARLLHMEVKNRGYGELTKFIKYETIHTPNQYYYRLRKKGVMPFKSREASKGKNIVSFKSSRSLVDPRIAELEGKIKMLENQIQAINISPAARAVEVLSIGFKDLGHRSRVFLAQIIAKNYASLSSKQEKWLSDLEAKYL